jgi:hypothetical protein
MLTPYPIRIMRTLGIRNFYKRQVKYNMMRNIWGDNYLSARNAA